MENKELIINYKDELCNMWEDNNNIKVKYFSDDTPRLKIEPKGDMIDLSEVKNWSIIVLMM